MGELFLTAEWRHLVMINYEIDPSLLLPFVPAGTEIDSWEGKTFVSLVGFRFLKTRIAGFLPIPWRANFEEVNLRFYVRRAAGNELRRGVVFLREFVPARMVAFVARTFYNENYVALPMSHEIQSVEDGLRVTYAWRSRGRWNKVWAASAGEPVLAREGSIEQFITEHYWGYTAQRDGECMEYRVVHPPWRAWQVRIFSFEGDGEDSYGALVGRALQSAPHSAFLAEGSPVSVLRGRTL
jgi:uncharacterized protein